MSLIVRIIPFIFLGVVAAALYPAGYDKPEYLWGLIVVKYAPVGLVGLLIAGELAGYMSTVDSIMNWGASYLVNDVYKRYLRPDAPEKTYAIVSKFVSAGIIFIAFFVAYFLVEGMKVRVFHL